MEFRKYDKNNEDEKNFEKEEISKFLFTHLEKYGDKLESIEMAMDYAVSKEIGKGGFVLVAYKDDVIVGTVVINKTGMGGYIPENILVYIAVHSETRGKGYGRKLMEKAIAETEGDIALHVEANNPAKKLYEKLGFTNPYLEMRLKK
ncbi:MAG: GNAT family N-acetyltransferase [Ignavibacteriae bacterium HGW-Ignavibacteriae-4]|jgi:ribosomal protein S18 acetylase RimI-like enzyme|nr:MAG: GNAT family N-acetyltransferase [Ignavibacteriae bacterium HGW-Ignavibacteriae-4]